MLAKKKRVFAVRDVGDFIREAEKYPDLKKIIDEYIENYAKEMDMEIEELKEILDVEFGYSDLDKILEKADNRWVTHFDYESGYLHLIEI